MERSRLKKVKKCFLGEMIPVLSQEGEKGYSSSENMNKNTNVSKKEKEHSGAKSTSWSKVIPNQIFRRLHKEKKKSPK